MATPPSPVTQLLHQLGAGHREALSELVPLVYAELHRLAAIQLRGERRRDTLQPTALVNEAFIKLVAQDRTSWQSRAHFFGIAARLMRRIVVDHARARLAEKRGGDAAIVALTGDDHLAPEAAIAPEQVLAIAAALDELDAIDETQARVVEARFFAGLNVEETAEALGVSASTVKREWAVARAWLHRRLSTET